MVLLLMLSDILEASMLGPIGTMMLSSKSYVTGTLPLL